MLSKEAIAGKKVRTKGIRRVRVEEDNPQKQVMKENLEASNLQKFEER